MDRDEERAGRREEGASEDHLREDREEYLRGREGGRDEGAARRRGNGPECPARRASGGRALGERRIGERRRRPRQGQEEVAGSITLL